MTWQDDWPLIGVDYDHNGVGEPVPSWKKPVSVHPQPSAVPATTDEFDSRAMGLQWQWHANHDPAWADLSARPGWLRFQARPLIADWQIARAPHFLGQKFSARSFEAETLLDPSMLGGTEHAGLALVGNTESAAISVRKNAKGCELIQIAGGEAYVICPAPDSPVRLRIRVAPDGTCTFLETTAAGDFAPLPLTWRAPKDGWIGVKVGLYAVTDAASGAGHADFDYLRFFPLSC